MSAGDPHFITDPITKVQFLGIFMCTHCPLNSMVASSNCLKEQGSQESGDCGLNCSKPRESTSSGCVEMVAMDYVILFAFNIRWATTIDV